MASRIDSSDNKVSLKKSCDKEEGIYTRCNPPSVIGHHYSIVVVDYFTKWEETMPTYSNDAKIVALFLLNHIIARFGIPKSIVTDHGMHFYNAMMAELTSMLRLDHEYFLRPTICRPMSRLNLSTMF